ncbi:MAG: AAA family ATPase, partial [Myxococcota bacterium]
MLIPYGLADFRRIREESQLFVDKSEYIRLLETSREGGPFIAWLRPRRFGKSTFLSMLHSYYDLKQKDDFERLFGELAIGKNPTPEHNRYLVLRL